MNELKPCPFCGSKASIIRRIDYDGNSIYGVFCDLNLYSEHSHGHYVDNYTTEEEAVRAWNNRHDDIYIVKDVDYDGSWVVGYHTNKDKAKLYADYLDDLAEESGRFNDQFYQMEKLENLDNIDYLRDLNF